MTNSRLLPAFTIAVAACAGALEVCTEVGCDSGLIVTVTNGPAEPYRIEARVGGTLARYVHSCAGHACTAEFLDFVPSHVFIYVMTESDTTFREVRPNYDVSQPNGPDCEPTCRFATVTITL